MGATLAALPYLFTHPGHTRKTQRLLLSHHSLPCIRCAIAAAAAAVLWSRRQVPVYPFNGAPFPALGMLASVCNCPSRPCRRETPGKARRPGGEHGLTNASSVFARACCCCLPAAAATNCTLEWGAWGLPASQYQAAWPATAMRHAGACMRRTARITCPGHICKPKTLPFQPMPSSQAAHRVYVAGKLRCLGCKPQTPLVPFDTYQFPPASLQSNPLCCRPLNPHCLPAAADLQWSGELRSMLIVMPCFLRVAMHAATLQSHDQYPHPIPASLTLCHSTIPGCARHVAAPPSTMCNYHGPTSSTSTLQSGDRRPPPWPAAAGQLTLPLLPPPSPLPPSSLPALPRLPPAPGSC